MVSKTILLLTILVCLVGSPITSWAQEAVSATTDTSTSSSSAPTNEPGPGATGTAPAGGVSSSTGAEAPVAAAPSGVGIFARAPVEISATISTGYDSNVNTSSQQQSSGYSNVNVTLDYKFGGPRLQLSLGLGAGATYFWEHVSGQEYDVDIRGAFGVTYKASPRLTLGSTVLVEYLTEPSFEYAGGLNSRNGNYLYTTDKLFVAYNWSPRFSTKTSYTFEAFNYDDSAVAAFSNRVSNTFGNEFRFQLVPTTLLAAEYRYSIVSYENGFLDSTSHYALAGVDHTFNPRLSGSIRGGAEFRSYDSDGDRSGPYFEGNLTYAVGRRTTVSWNNRYGLEEPDVPTAQSRTTFRTGVQAKFGLTPRIGTIVDLYYVHDEFHPLTTGPFATAGFSENTFDAGISLRYKITNLFSLQAGYHYTDVSSDVAGREYARNRIFAGVSATF